VKAQAEQHLEAAADYIAVAEAGDAKRLAYEKAADAILAAMAADESLTQRSVGERLGKSRQWVGDLLGWRARRDHGMPFSNVDAAARYRERQVPTRHEDRVEMAAKLLDDPQVREDFLAHPSPAQRKVEHDVRAKGAEERRAAIDRAEQRRVDEALPLPAHLRQIAARLDEVSITMAALRDDVAELEPSAGADVLRASVQELIRQAEAWLEALRGSISFEVIEGRAARR